MNEKSFYKATLQVEYEDAKGKLKKRREEYIIEAISPTDVEAKVTTHLKGSTEDSEISSIVLTKIIDILR
jgi:hypothetical protein